MISSRIKSKRKSDVKIDIIRKKKEGVGMGQMERPRIGYLETEIYKCYVLISHLNSSTYTHVHIHTVVHEL